MKRIAILGSTGSIGVNTLKVISHFPDRFRVIGLTTNSNIGLLSEQIKEFKPRFACVSDNKAGLELRKRLNTADTKLFIGAQGLQELVSVNDIDKVVLAISGAAALMPLMKALECGREVALANKEALVMAGPLIMESACKKKTKIIPVDSEQSAIWQCLGKEPRSKLKHIYLTASGGPFRTTSPAALKNISVSRVLRHPRWKMGKKISVDSATLMNKGLELLESMFLFGVQAEKIKILIHPEALIHSMVEFIDGVVLAQLSSTDMRIPIQYALSYPDRISNSLPVIDFYKLRELHFSKPDFKKFPCLDLAYRAARGLGTMPCVLNAANEVAVSEFLGKGLDFISIPKVIEKVIDRHRNKLRPDLDDIVTADNWAREEACRVIKAI